VLAGTSRASLAVKMSWGAKDEERCKDDDSLVALEKEKAD